MTRPIARVALVAALVVAAAACGSSRGDAPLAEPVAHPEAAARAFRLFYRERVERAVLAWNRFSLVGDSTMAVTMDRSAVARDGTRYEIVVGPEDNNRIGQSTFAVYQAHRIFGGRDLELTLLRMFEGLAFIAEVSGVPGVTAREAWPGWTRRMDGIERRVERTRDGAPVASPLDPDPALEREILDTFFDGVEITYREDPSEFYFSFMPAWDPVAYSITYAFSELPRFIRSRDCCSSLMRTPEGARWEGAFWGNHNSRDNSQDLAIGYLTAREAAADPRLSREVRAAARRAVDAGRAAGDLVQRHGGRIMTIDEFHPYGELRVSGELRPDGVLEPQDLGSLAACPRAYLQRGISSAGLAAPVPELPLPGSIESLIGEALGPLSGLVDCEIPDGVRMCRSLDDAYCGATAAGFRDLRVLGLPWFDTLRLVELLSPGTAAGLLGGFQDDYREIVAAGGALVYGASLSGDPELERQARAALADETELLRAFADLVYGRRAPEALAAQRYEAALREALAGLPPRLDDLVDLALAEQRIAAIEELLELDDTEPAALMSDARIVAAVEARLASPGAYDHARFARYRERFGDGPPVRRAGEGYEARGPDGVWRPAERPRHVSIGGFVLLEELALCRSAPEVLDCTWATAGCARADLDGDGRVDATDRSLFERAAASAGTRCAPRDDWCGGADLDRTGAVDALDAAFLGAAEGCWYAP